MERYADSPLPSLEAPACPICEVAMDPGKLTCRGCAYGGLTPETFVRFFWEEA